MTDFEHPYPIADTSIQPLDVFAMDDATLAGEAAYILFGEISKGAALSHRIREMNPPEAIRLVLGLLLGDGQPHAHSVKRFDTDSDKEAAKKSAILTELASRMVKRVEVDNG